MSQDTGGDRPETPQPIVFPPQRVFGVVRSPLTFAEEKASESIGGIIYFTEQVVGHFVQMAGQNADVAQFYDYALTGMPSKPVTSLLRRAIVGVYDVEQIGIVAPEPPSRIIS